MSASSTDYYTKVGQPGNATVLAAPGHLIGGTSINVDSTSLWPTDTGVIFAIDTTTLVGGVETRNTGSYTVWEGVVTSATSIGSMVLLSGTDQNYSAGSTTRVYILPTSARENRLVDGLLLEHDQNGEHKDIIATSVSTDTISEKTSAAGVTIDSLRIKDGKLDTDNSVITSNIADDAVITAKIADGAVTVDKLSNPYKFRVTRTSNQTGITDSSYTKVAFDSKTYDTNNNFSTVTNSYTVPITGYYQINVLLKATGTNITALGVQLLKGTGTVVIKNIDDFAAIADSSIRINDLIFFNAGDVVYVETYINVSTGSGTVIGATNELLFSGFLQSV